MHHHTVTIQHYLGPHEHPLDDEQQASYLAAAHKLVESLHEQPSRQVEWYEQDRLVQPSAAMALGSSYQHPLPPELERTQVITWLSENPSTSRIIADSSSPSLILDSFAHYGSRPSAEKRPPKRPQNGGGVEKAQAKKQKTVNFLLTEEDQSRDNIEAGNNEHLESEGREANKPKTRQYPLTSTPVAATDTTLELPSFELGLHIGAIQRCIPSPYRHLTHIEGRQTPPQRRHPSKILHSYVDPLPLTSTSSTHAKARTCLLPGLRGAWLLPISGPFPWSDTSPPSWDLHPSPPVPSSTLHWTDDRLKALWRFVDQLRTAGTLGSIHVTTFISNDPSSSTPPTSIPDYIKINCDAHLALEVRTLLKLVRVAKKDEGPDSEEFLKLVRLVWVDARGRPILLA